MTSNPTTSFSPRLVTWSSRTLVSPPIFTGHTTPPVRPSPTHLLSLCLLWPVRLLTDTLFFRSSFRSVDYEAQRRDLLKRHGIDLEEPGTPRAGAKRLDRKGTEEVFGGEQGLLTWRDKNRKKLAYSVAGTNSYMSPEVIRGLGYGFSCDWWSLGVIMVSPRGTFAPEKWKTWTDFVLSCGWVC